MRIVHIGSKRTSGLRAAIILLAALALTGIASPGDAAVGVVVNHARGAQGTEVTLKGSLVCNGACIPDPKTDDHIMVLFAIDGTSEVRAEAEKIVTEFYPNKGLDADSARKLMDRFSARAKYYLAPDSPALRDSKNTGKNHYCMPATASAVTGIVTLRDGRRWIAATRIEPARLRYSDRMLAADRPFVMPHERPVTLKIGERLELRCVYIPPGRFLMGTPVYMWPYFMEEFPHVVKLTRPFYMAEIPVTQAMYEAVMGSNPSAMKDPQLPVENPRFADIETFCRRLSELNNRTVRLPTDAEWEYAARVGTSNPGFGEKYKEQNSTGPSGFKSPLPVRSRQPNAWGLYDMASCWWEVSADKGMYYVRHNDVDPHYPPLDEGAKTSRSGLGVVKDGWSICTHEFITEKPDYTGQKFRVIVEAAAT